MEYKKGFYKLGDKVEFQNNIYVLKATSLYSQSIIQEANDGYWINITSPSTGGGGLPSPLILTGDPNVLIRTLTDAARLSLTDASGDFFLGTVNGGLTPTGTIMFGDPIGGTSAGIEFNSSLNRVRISTGFSVPSIEVLNMAVSIATASGSLGFFGSTSVTRRTIAGPEWTSFETAYPNIADMLSANLGYGLVSNNS